MRLPRHAGLPGLLLLSAASAFSQTPRPAAEPPISGGAAVVSRTPDQSLVPAEAPMLATTESAPQPIGYESDLHCFGYLGQESESYTARVIGAEHIAEQEDFTTDDRLYLNGGADRGLKHGDEYWLITPEEEILHPVRTESLGRFYKYRGRAVVEHVEGRTATVRVTHACTEIPIGSYLKPFEPIPIPLARRSPPAMAGDPPSGKVMGRIVHSRDGIVALGEDTTVIVDLGEGNGLQPGDFLTVFRYASGREYGIRPVGAYWVNVPPPPGVVIPRTYLGEIAVLAVGDRWAIGRIMNSFRLIEVGDEVELK